MNGPDAHTGTETRSVSPFQRTVSQVTNSRALVNVMYLPALLLLGIFVAYPLVRGLAFAFTNWDGYSDTFRWVGLEKYIQIPTDPKILTAMRNTLIYGLGSTLLQNGLGLAYALFLDRPTRGRSLVRTLVYLPVIISPLIMGYIWYFFFQYDGGAINDILRALGKDGADWLGNRDLVVWLIMLVNTYQYMGIAMIVYLAGLQAIPREYHEAAIIDGAGAVARFRHVTWPLLIPAVTVNVVLNLIGGLKLFDVIVAMTNGGPGYASQSLSTLMYDLYFNRQDAGYAAAVGNFMFVLICCASIPVLLYLRRKEVRL